MRHNVEEINFIEVQARSYNLPFCFQRAAYNFSFVTDTDRRVLSGKIRLFAGPVRNESVTSECQSRPRNTSAEPECRLQSVRKRLMLMTVSIIQRESDLLPCQTATSIQCEARK